MCRDFPKGGPPLGLEDPFWGVPIIWIVVYWGCSGASYSEFMETKISKREST